MGNLDDSVDGVRLVSEDDQDDSDSGNEAEGENHVLWRVESD